MALAHGFDRWLDAVDARLDHPYLAMPMAEGPLGFAFARWQERGAPLFWQRVADAGDAGIDFGPPPSVGEVLIARRRPGP